MADSCSSSIDSSIINNDQSIQNCDIENSSTKEKSNTKIPTNGKMMFKKKITSKQYRQLTYKLKEIKQIIYEENLIHEKINRLNLKKQYLQNILLLLHVMDSVDGMKHSPCR
ncbi:unnamed protein product [Rotaria sordida]|uniref:Uncharacterized protein n=1 Tax=Rotaria sordida TaxID=392033 RepID=A0A813RDJ7_9BILA|nr:unnamed protein product [Rotaria sordida]CAF1009011.1 unnamed protein product [Rotaria sordida]CAF1205568.1 unnamed protein product [Rotaria sordida]CAF3545347.1 unnamed protein product [Rotaria sordida]CAF3609462.1 unnamed protein product [Rotaria sordida]